MPIDVRSAKKADLRLLSRILGQAFHEDPLMRWVLPDVKARTRALPTLFAALTRYHYLPGGGVEVAEREYHIGAAALWAPPGRWRETRIETLRMMPRICWALRDRLSTFQGVLEATERIHPDEPHWYLAIIGSQPEARGKGFTQALLRARLDHCDATNTPAYLESTNPENVPYYERFGFQVTREFRSNGSPPLWAMWRPPSVIRPR
jgi:GNAT superfamily N-acetyltransferase